MSPFLKKINELFPIIRSICEHGGTPYLVGGSVRDFVLGLEVKDFDIEVHNMSVDDLEVCLKKFGTVSLVGKQFGVLKLHGTGTDWSLPRKDSFGRKPQIVVDSTMTIAEAGRRRDLTINAMAIDLSSVREEADIKIIDPYGGLKDIKSKVLRLIDKDLFVQDPLRFYRVMQFIGRFEMTPDEELNEVCKCMDLREVAKGGELARERIYEEIKKLLLQSRRPSLGFRWLKSIGRLKELYPELGVLVGLEQRADYHPEGDVFEHTMQSLDAAARLELSEVEKFTIMLGVLCHDFGKVEKTTEEGGARGHDVAGVPHAKTFLRRFTWNSSLIKAVCKLVRYHRMPIVLVEQKAAIKAYKRLALKLAPETTMMQLYWLSWSDIRGRNKEGTEPLGSGFMGDDETLSTFLENSKSASVETGPEAPVLHGRDLLDVVEPGPKMGELLKKAYSIQIDEEIKDPRVLKARVLNDEPEKVLKARASKNKTKEG